MREVRHYAVPDRHTTVVPSDALRKEAARHEQTVRSAPTQARIDEVLEKGPVRSEKRAPPFRGALRDEYRYHVALFEEHAAGRVDGTTMASVMSMYVVRNKVDAVHEVLASAPGRFWLTARELRRCLTALRRIAELDFDVTNRGGPPILNEVMRGHLRVIAATLIEARARLRDDLEAIETGDEDLHDLDPDLPTHGELAREVLEVLRASNDRDIQTQARTLAEMPERVVSIAESVL